MSSGGGPEGYCRLCGEYSQSSTINHGGLCLACEGKCGLIPDPLSDLRRRIEKLEARIAEYEAELTGPCPGKPETCIKECSTCVYQYFEPSIYPCNYCGAHLGYPKWEEDKPKSEQWKPYPIYFNFESIVPHPQAQWMEEKLTRYTKQLQWLYEHYPEQNGEWGKDTQWFVYFYDDDEEWDTSADSDSPTLNLIYMSLGAAQHLRYDLNSGKVRF